MFRPSLAFATALVVLLTPARLPAQVVQERVDLSIVQRIRDEALNRSQIPELAGYPRWWPTPSITWRRATK